MNTKATLPRASSKRAGEAAEAPGGGVLGHGANSRAASSCKGQSLGPGWTRNRVRGPAVLVACEPAETGTLVSLRPEGSGSTQCQQRALRVRSMIGGGQKRRKFLFSLGAKRNIAGKRETWGSSNLLRIYWLRGLDLNQRPLGYEPNELPDCSTPHLDSSNRSPQGQTTLPCRC